MPKGKISPQLAAVLRDKRATAQIRESITSGKAITVRIDGKSYRVSSRGASKGEAYTSKSISSRTKATVK
jgi:hypothetical protein